MNIRRQFVALTLGAAIWFLPAGSFAAGDWLLNPSPFRAAISTNTGPDEIRLENGLVRRVIKLSPEAATVAFDNLTTGESILRSVRPEALLELGCSM